MNAPSRADVGDWRRTAVSVAVSLVAHALLLLTFGIVQFRTPARSVEETAREIAIDTTIAAIEVNVLEVPAPPTRIEPPPASTLAIAPAAAPRVSFAPSIADAASQSPSDQASAAGTVTQSRAGATDATGQGIGRGSGRGRGKSGPTSTFFGVESIGRRIVYVIDRSGSMENNNALDVAKQELLASLRSAPAGSQFRVIVYNEAAHVLGSTSKDLPYATGRSIAQLAEQLDRIIAQGGTNHLAALRKAIALRPEIIYWLTDADDLTTHQADLIAALLITRHGPRPHLSIIQFCPDGAANSTSVTAAHLSQSTGGAHRSVNPKTWRPATLQAN